MHRMWPVLFAALLWSCGGRSAATAPTPAAPSASNVVLSVAHVFTFIPTSGVGYSYSVDFCLQETAGKSMTITGIDYVFSNSAGAISNGHQSDPRSFQAQTICSGGTLTDSNGSHPIATSVAISVSFSGGASASISGSVPPLVVQPVIVKFETSATTIQPGEPVTLTWSTEKADTCHITPDAEIGSVPCNGSTTLKPSSATSRYVLFAKNSEREITSAVEITVNYPDVEYRVTTSAAPRVSLITYAGSGGSTLQESGAPTPWTRTITPSSGAFLYLSAQNDNFNTCVTVSITIRGSLSKIGTSCGPFTIATVSGLR